jgi:hypothetical protein
MDSDASGIAIPSLNVRVLLFVTGPRKVLILMQQFSIPAFTNPVYDLVALHLEHFFPTETFLTVYYINYSC